MVLKACGLPCTRTGSFCSFCLLWLDVRIKPLLRVHTQCGQKSRRNARDWVLGEPQIVPRLVRRQGIGREPGDAVCSQIQKLELWHVAETERLDCRNSVVVQQQLLQVLLIAESC